MSINTEPLPIHEAPLPTEAGEETAHDKAIEAPVTKEQDAHQPAFGARPTSTQAPVTPPAPVAPVQPTAVQAPASPKTTNLPADDTDLIEKEWVDRAKAIVSATQDDPHKQKHEISKVKAEYIQKRFNKTIKVDGTA